LEEAREGFGKPGAGRALLLATFALAVNFWAWNLLSPLVPTYRSLLQLSPLQAGLLAAVPTLVGALARIPVGALTDRFGGRVVFAAVTAAAIPPVLLLATAESYATLLAGGLLLGVAGASFAVGVPFLTAWIPPKRRGLALGIYGMGNGGTAIAGFTAPAMAECFWIAAPYVVVAIALAATALALILLARDAPARVASTESMFTRTLAALRLPIARDLALLYAITFGGFVAMGVYLPTFLTEVYEITFADAAARAAGFIAVATLSRPVGGALSDRYGGARVLLFALVAIGVGAIVTAFEPVIAAATVGFLLVAAAMGVGNGAVFALVGSRAPAAMVGSVTGLVGAMGGLGGFLPPIMMGLVYQATGSYAIGLMLLSDVAFAGAVYAAWRVLRQP